ncbi:C-C motif chemokine 15-like [Erinaceus europaeus]|uniref:C-C motif chemokine 15-like n=1 Tax=Erinaceus europaeus TaxID=9365 RepID=A0A1S3W3Q9_ERIEU|nr:C-C motif chemokine 15-like [Erinaceus europaeus]
MKLSVRVLAILFLAVALGKQVQIIHEPVDIKENIIFSMNTGSHHPPDCCSSTSYFNRKIPCALMENYFETSSGCSQPGVIFRTKKKKLICANPLNEDVKNCMMFLKEHSETVDLRKMRLI